MRRMVALAACALLALPATFARADGSDEPPAGNERVIKIGPQMVVIEDEHGNVRMYDDPSQQAPACKSNADCWGKSLNIFAAFGILTYEDWTTNTEGGVSVVRTDVP